MAESILELTERTLTDKKLSFGLYIVFLIVIVVIGIVTGIIATIFTGFTGFGAGKIISTLISFLVAIYLWWYNWLLYKRRNQHFDRIKRLKINLSKLIKEKFDSEVVDPGKTDPLLTKREAHHSKPLFVFWLIFSYLGNLGSFSRGFGVFSILSVILGLIVVYYLTVDYYYHEQGELAFFGKVGEILKGKNISFNCTLAHPLQRRRYGLYIFLSIITLGIFSIYWAFVLFRDPNHHFDTHEFLESQLEQIIQQQIT